MKKFILRIFINLERFLRKKGNVWKTDKQKVLIFEPDALRKEAFQEKVQNKAYDDFEFIFTSSKFSYLNLIKDADIIYCYSIHDWIKIENLKMLYLGVVGYNIPSKYCEHNFIYTAPNYSSNYISDYILATITAFERKLIQKKAFRHSKHWKQKFFLEPTPKAISDLKIGIIGLGKIGKKVANMFNLLGSEVHSYDIADNINDGFIYAMYNKSNWKEMLNIIDYLVLTIPYTKNTHHLIDQEIINSMNKNICIVNISRGGIIDEKALISGLKTNKIRGAILDVFNNEPIPKRDQLLKLNNVVITPHISGNINLVYNQIQKDFLSKISDIN